MALKLHLKRFTGLKERTVWQARATFRGVSYRTKSCALSAGQDEARLDEVFEWPIGRPIDPHETLDIHLINKSKYNIAGVNRSVAGTYRMVLQELLTQKHLVICDDVLIDLNNQPTSTGVTMELHYVVPNDSLYQVEQSLSELERQYAAAIQSAQASGQSSDTDTDATGERHMLLKTRKRSMGSAVRNIANIMKLKHKRRSSPGVSDDEADDCSVAITVGPTIAGAQYGSTHSILRHMSDNTLDMLAAGSRLGASSEDAHAITSPVLVKKIRPSGHGDSLKAQDFQICVTIIEARHLAGLNMDPVVCVQVGEQRKYTSVKESTNCPYYNEYFVFDFHCAEAVLFDKMVTITALHSRNLIRSGKVIGTFKLDVATIFRQPDHQFWHKWAVLTDPDDMSGGPKGYVKCDISVIGKGEASKPPSTTRSTSANHEQDDDIEGNLLLPEGMPTERQHARYIVSIHEADGLPRANGGNLVASVKKVLAQDSQRQLIDPYVQVSFAGLTGKTSVKKSCCSPAWNEQIVFTEMFPPLCQRIKLQLRDNGPVKDSVIATHFIDISKISNDGDKGFLPTFGPCYIYLYGSARSSDSVFQRGSAHAPLNDGLAEGVMYRGRLLVSVRTQVLPEMAVMQLPPSVHVEGAPPVTEDNPTKNEDFFLSAVIMEGHMIDKRFTDKPVHFELSIGNAGNTLDGEHGVDSSEWKSTTPSMKPISGPEPGEHLHMGFGHCKPVIWVRSSWPDYRRRLYLSNMLHRILERLEFGVSDVLEMVRLERGDADRRLRGVLEQLASDCAAYLQHYKQEHPSKSSTRVRRSKLDRERERHCQREVDHMGTMARAMKPLLNRHSFKEKLQATQMFIRKLKDICEDAQHSLPDVFVWMLVQGRRVAYHRIPARLIIYSVHDEQRGSLCERRQTFLLKPGGGNKKQTPSSAWNVEASLELYIWLGLWSERDQSLRGVPEGYSNTGVPFEKLQYTERSKFILRAHMYQARSLIASDSSGLSDPFAQVHFCGHCASTQVIEQTLSPTWDEMVLLQKIELCGELPQLSEDPPLVVVNVFDQDNVGKCEFLGRAMVKPHVKLGFTETEYKVPQLEWHDLYRSPNENAGQLLAVFELIECNSITGDSAGRVESVEPIWRNDRGPVLPIPKSIRPTLSRYKIEFLFWGLRDLRRVNLLKVDRPRVDIECGGHTIQSSIINNYAKNPNFSMPIKTIDIDLPDQEIYCPPVTIRVVDCRSFGRFTLVGTHVISSIHRFIQLTAQEAFENQKRVQAQKANQVPTETLIDVEGGTATATNGGPTTNSQVTVIHLNPSKDAKFSDGNLASIEDFDPSYQNAPTSTEKEPSKGKKKQAKKRKERGSMTRNDDLSEDSKDWWSRYFASIQSQHKSKGNPDDGFHSDRLRSLFDQYSMIKVYTAELESVPEYNGFKEWLESFQLLRGKRTGDENDDERRIVGIFKGSLRVHRYPLSGDWEPLSRSVPSNDPIKVLVRVYIVRATDLHPADLNGKADPYLVIRLGQNKLSDKDNYVSKQLNPVFGKCFQFEAIFPHDSLLHIQVFDWDLLGRDDLIGETKIDLENRFYSKHRATCGLPLKYDTEAGPNQWRDPLKPSQILQKICKENKVDGPHCLPPGNRVRVGPRTFAFKTDDQEFDGIHHSKTSKKQRQENYEHMSLAILHRWSEVLEGNALVTEHVETRPLFHPEKAAGIEQGKLDMWVDMFPMDTGQPLPGPPVDISPRKPKSFELRVIIWNTDEVVLEDDAFFTGEKMSDIYVKGWLKGPEDTQSTDIHYRSLTGEGNFNWRFVFPFEYLPAEEKIVISRKESLFSWDETESKIPARLQLQVWDADHFSADDFLGALTLDLNRFPRGAKTATQCSLDILRPDAPHVSIFKQRRIKGWWPFFVKRSDDQQMELTGKVEAELHLLTGEEAERNPAGLGRSEPDPLEKPNRPDASFVWFLNPLKSVKYIVWHRYKWFILKAILIFLFGLMLALFVYSIPGYTVKKMLGA